MSKKNDYIPALRFKMLTKLFDPFLRFTMPERRFKAEFIKHAGISENDTILDFGCGTGTLALMIKERFPTAKLYGVDVDNTVLEIARRKVEKEKTEIVLSKYDGVRLPFQDSTFDKVVTTLVFHHLTHKQKLGALAEIYRVLRKGGELHIGDFGRTSNAFLRGAFFIWRLLDGLENTKDNAEGKMLNIVENAGFTHVVEKEAQITIFGSLYFYSAVKE